MHGFHFIQDLAIILVVPLCLLFAIGGVWFKGSDNNIFTQIGFIVLIVVSLLTRPPARQTGAAG